VKHRHYKLNIRVKFEERQEFNDTVQHILSFYTSLTIELYIKRKDRF